MVKCVGICLAGGKAERWNHYPKEMLPIGNGQTLLDRTIKALRDGGADRIMFMTSKEKAQMHVNHLGGSVDYFIKTSENMWDSMAVSFQYEADKYLFAMPDTYIPEDTFADFMDGDFSLGVFETGMPERFGVVTENGVVNKQKLPAGLYNAWGALGWTDKVVEYWKSIEVDTYTDAINAAMIRFGYKLKQMDYYFDLASWKDYVSLLREVEL